MTKEQFLEWKNENPITIEFFKFLLEEAKARRYLLANGAFDREVDFAKMGQSVTKLLLQAEVYELVQDIQYEDIVSDESTPSRVSSTSTTGVSGREE